MFLKKFQVYLSHTLNENKMSSFTYELINFEGKPAALSVALQSQKDLTQFIKTCLFVKRLSVNLYRSMDRTDQCCDIIEHRFLFQLSEHVYKFHFNMKTFLPPLKRLQA